MGAAAATTTAPVHSMDVSKVRLALAATKAAIKDVVDNEIKARSFNGLKGLTRVDTLMAEAEEKLDAAVKSSQPKVRKKKAKKAA